LEHGDEKSQEAVLKRCVEADPHHGEVWCSVSKQPANWKLKADGILKTVAAGIVDVFPPF
jgi:pre-mRNA-processing factor 6